MAFPIRTNAEFGAALDGLVSAFPGLVTKSTAGTSVQGRDMFYITIANPSGAATKTPVMVMAGVHAREWAPPDALLSFVTALLSQGTSGPPDYTPQPIRYPSFVRPDKGIRFPRASISINEVKSVINNLSIVVLPLANPDGREFSLTSPILTNMWQRKNRHDFGTTTACPFRPNPGPDQVLLDEQIGADINRNFPIGWDVDSYYSPTYLTSEVRISKTACVPGPFNFGESYRGPTVHSEPETQNIINLITAKSPTYFVDLHSAAKTLLYSWQLTNTQTSDPTSNYQNAALNGTRDGTYGEYLPQAIFEKARTLAGGARKKILEMRTRTTSSPEFNSDYAVRPKKTKGSATFFKVPLYPAPGTSLDSVTALQLSTVASPTPGAAESLVPPERYAITMEAGSFAHEGKFWPDPTNVFPKIEREIHFALWSVLAKAGAAASGVPVKP